MATPTGGRGDETRLDEDDQRASDAGDDARAAQAERAHEAAH